MKSNEEEEEKTLSHTQTHTHTQSNRAAAAAAVALAIYSILNFVSWSSYFFFVLRFAFFLILCFTLLFSSHLIAPINENVCASLSLSRSRSRCSCSCSLLFVYTSFLSKLFYSFTRSRSCIQQIFFTRKFSHIKIIYQKKNLFSSLHEKYAGAGYRNLCLHKFNLEFTIHDGLI